jgi:hypothetical protein
LCIRPGVDRAERLRSILQTAIFLTRAHRGNIQLLDAASGSLVIAAHDGFEKPFLDFFARVDPRSHTSVDSKSSNTSAQLHPSPPSSFSCSPLRLKNAIANAPSNWAQKPIWLNPPLLKCSSKPWVRAPRQIYPTRRLAACDLFTAPTR